MAHRRFFQNQTNQNFFCSTVRKYLKFEISIWNGTSMGIVFLDFHRKKKQIRTFVFWENLLPANLLSVLSDLYLLSEFWSALVNVLQIVINLMTFLLFKRSERSSYFFYSDRLKPIILKNSDLVPRWSEKAIKTLVTVLRQIFVCHVRSDLNQLLGVWGKDCTDTTQVICTTCLDTETLKVS